MKPSFTPGPHSLLLESPQPDLTLTLSSELCWSKRRAWLRTRLEQLGNSNITADELDIHFSAMPQHYWESVSEAELEWGLESIHGFLEMIASPETSATAPFISWRQLGTSGKVKVMLCTWDRHGLLAKAAAAFSAVRLSIVQADVFTRSDDIVLDTFTVAGADGFSPVNRSQMEQMRFLLEGALSEPPRFASIWACSRHKFLAPPSPAAPKIAFNNDESNENTVVHIEMLDRLGLLYDILQAIADSGLNIKQAQIQTTNGFARDLIYVTNQTGQKVVEQEQLDSIRARLEASVTVSP